MSKLPGKIFLALFAMLAILAVGYGLFGIAAGTHRSWIMVTMIILSVVISSTFQVSVGRSNTFPMVGVTITMLSIVPVHAAPLFSVAVWSIGVVLSQLLSRRNLPYALYLTGLSAVAATGYASIRALLEPQGFGQMPALLLATAAYYGIYLTGELTRQALRPSDQQGYKPSILSPLKTLLMVLSTGVLAVFMNVAADTVLPWLDGDPESSRGPLILILTAGVFFVLAQRVNTVRSERSLKAITKAAVELPHERGLALETELRKRAQTITRAQQVELRETAPTGSDIGAAVRLEPGANQFLVASQKFGGVPFAAEDQRALDTLAHVASEAARARYEVDLLTQRANSDALTGLPNYGAFQQALDDANRNREYHEGIALLFIDLDHFKDLNDTRGHRAGDQLLRAIAERLKSASGGGDFVSRVGGDEFVVIITGLDSLEQAKESAERIVAVIGQPLAIDGVLLQHTVSAGLAYSGHRELDAQTLVEDADRTMLRAKRTRKQSAGPRESELQISSHRSTRTNDSVARAIRGSGLSVAFQPIVDISVGEIWAFEALVRYIDPELGPVSPVSLVARAKGLGLLNELTVQVVTKALDAAEQFRSIVPSITCMTVNLELGQLDDSELGPFLIDCALAHPELSICVELNERSLRNVTQDSQDNTNQIRASGLRIALDDYGSDDSPVRALINFPMDILKLDKSLIDDLGDSRQREVVRALQGFGDNLDCTVIVEGVEDATTAETLRDLGVRSVQGYYFGRPMPLSLTLDRLKRSGAKAKIDA